MSSSVTCRDSLKAWHSTSQYVKCNLELNKLPKGKKKKSKWSKVSRPNFHMVCIKGYLKGLPVDFEGIPAPNPHLRLLPWLSRRFPLLRGLCVTRAWCSPSPPDLQRGTWIANYQGLHKFVGGLCSLAGGKSRPGWPRHEGSMKRGVGGTVPHYPPHGWPLHLIRGRRGHGVDCFITVYEDAP